MWLSSNWYFVNVVKMVQFVSFCSLAYGVKMLKNIVEARKKCEIYVMYDIACTMQKHLQV